MAIALICSTSFLEDELKDTAVGRDGITRHTARTAEEALQQTAELHPDVVLIDRDMAEAYRVVHSLRRDDRTRKVSIVVVARGELDSVEVDLLEAGANAILRLPISPEWDERLERLMTVPVRRELRVPVRFEMEARSGDGVDSQTATVLNLSVSGMLIDSPFPLEIGDDVDISFSLPGSDAHVKGTGRVVRRSGRTQFGIEFYGLEGDGRDLIAAWIQSGASE
jgi:CheY-like chemotaxis protein